MLGCNQTYIQPNANVEVTFSVGWENQLNVHECENHKFRGVPWGNNYFMNHITMEGTSSKYPQ